MDNKLFHILIDKERWKQNVYSSVYNLSLDELRELQQSLAEFIKEDAKRIKNYNKEKQYQYVNALVDGLDEHIKKLEIVNKIMYENLTPKHI